MAIRRRLTPAGVPHHRFIRYCKRFGQPYAAFESPAMQRLNGKDPGLITRGPASVEHWNRLAVEVELRSATDDGLDSYAAMLQGVLDNWPAWEAVSGLPRGAYSD